MHILSYPKRKYLLMIPIALMLFSVVYFRLVTHHINTTRLQEKIVEIIHLTDGLAAAVEGNPRRPWHEHDANVINNVEFIDSLYQVYAAAYWLEDGKLSLITKRNFETSIFEPLDYPDFIAAVNASENGTITIGYTPEDQDYRDLHMYFRWMPLYSPPDERYLVVAGVSKHSLTIALSLWVSIGLWIIVVVVLALCFTLAVRHIQLGYHWDSRADDPVTGKWRGKIQEPSRKEM
jgi:hypothetical protein